MKQPIKCTCGLEKGASCPKCSKIRMTILLKNGNDHLKLGHGKNQRNPVWYSYLKYNRYPPERIIQKMEERLRAHPKLGSAARFLQFYYNHDRTNCIKKIAL